MTRFWPVFGAVAGALPLITAIYLYKTGMMLYSQVGLVRTLGVLGVFALGYAAVAAVAAATALALKLDGEKPRLHRALGIGAYALMLANVAFVGLVIFFVSPGLAPKPWLVAASGLMLAGLVAFVRYAPGEQAFVLRTMTRSGLALLAVPLLASPVVVWAALHDAPRLPVVAPTLAVKPDAPKRIIVIGFDGLRAIDTSMADPAADVTPNLRALAEQATYFSGYRATSDRTLLSYPSILTGLNTRQIVPWIQNASKYLRQEALPNLPELLAPAGYRAHYATMLVNPGTFGMADDFAAGYTSSPTFFPNELNTRAFLPLAETLSWSLRKAFDSEFAPPFDDVRETRRTFEQARAILKASPDRTFLWLHVAAPHFPYYDVPASDLDGELHTERYEKITHYQAVRANAEQARRYQRIYANYLRFADAEFGRFMRGLKADGLWDDALVVVLSDHGESFTPGEMTHAFGSVSEEILHVPFLVRTPHQRDGKRVAGAASHIDVAPTVLGTVYDAKPAHLPGDSLLDAPPTLDRIRYAWAPPRKYFKAAHPRFLAAYQGNFKYTLGFPERREALYDLASDPAGLRDVAARHPAVLTRLRERTRQDMGL